MRKILKKVFSLFGKKDLQPPLKKRKSSGQSLVEFAIAFPILILLLSGVVEMGFILNYYLSLLDATREAARFSSGLDPFTTDPVTGVVSDNLTFYTTTSAMVRANLDPKVANPAYEGRRIILDPAVDDVIVTAYSAAGNTIIQYPSSGGYHIYGTHNSESIFCAANCPEGVQSIQGNRVLDAPNAGILVVEVHYRYHQVLALPWLTPFLPNPLPLQAYTIFPLNAAEPVVP